LAFHGTFEHSLDAKKRLTVPSKFRSALAGKVFLVKSKGCLSLYPGETYDRITETALAQINPLSEQARDLKRLFHSRAMDTELDGAGRVTLSGDLLGHAAIDREVVIAGAGDCLELWDHSAWQAYESDLASRESELTRSLGHSL
jgi:MraZ protein